MRYFIDTEFLERGPNRPIDLVSIGVVAEDGREYYAISLDFNPKHANQWVRDNVLVHLPPQRVPPWRSTGRIAPELVDFVDEGGDEPPEFWGWCCAFDYVVVTQLMGGMEHWPAGWPYYFNDIAQVAHERGSGLEEQPPGHQTSHHNALDDARWIKHLWEQLQVREAA